MATFFTADHHFGHAKIIRLSKRPFGAPELRSDRPWEDIDRNVIRHAVDEMNETMIARWNAVVRPQDTVYHLGDFCWGHGKQEHFLSRLNGTKHLAAFGNHDDRRVRQCSMWASAQFGLELKLQDQHIVCCHYALAVVPNIKKGTIVLFGHSHGSHRQDNRRLDVGVDCWDFRPVTLEEIHARLKTLPEFRSADHHGDAETASL
jgi:calcineurin-like phosphoesterase family protein